MTVTEEENDEISKQDFNSTIEIDVGAFSVL